MKVLAMPWFIPMMTMTLARFSSSALRGQTSPLMLQLEARKAACASRKSGLSPLRPSFDSASP